MTRLRFPPLLLCALLVAAPLAARPAVDASGVCVWFQPRCDGLVCIDDGGAVRACPPEPDVDRIPIPCRDFRCPDPP